MVVVEAVALTAAAAAVDEAVEVVGEAVEAEVVEVAVATEMEAVMAVGIMVEGEMVVAEVVCLGQQPLHSTRSRCRTVLQHCSKIDRWCRRSCSLDTNLGTLRSRRLPSP